MTTPQDPDDRTVFEPTASLPPAKRNEDSHGLPFGTRLGEFEITDRLGEGGFSMVYLAWDHSLERKVALKEYMPSSIAVRPTPTTIAPRSERHRDTFQTALRSFVNEAKLLAQFDHPALVKVYRFWEANGTAYMVMPLYQGKTVRDTVRAMAAPPDEAWIMQMLTPLAQALNVIHAQQCYHRDIAPDNIILLAETGRPLLLDFGAARRVIGDMTQALTVILKPGYAPVEQYDEVPGIKQGPWTDVYALAAVVHWMITGKTPPPSVGRMLSDSYVPLVQAAAGRYREGFLQAIDRALAVLPRQRTQTIDDLMAELQASFVATAPPATSPQHREADPEATVIRPAQPVPRAPAPAPVVAPAPVPRTVATPPREAPKQASPDTPRRNGSAGLAVAGVAGIGLLAAAAWWWTRAPSPEAVSPARPPVDVPATAPPPAAAPAPAPTAAVPATEAPPAAPPVAAPSPAPAPVTEATAPAPQPDPAAKRPAPVTTALPSTSPAVTPRPSARPTEKRNAEPSNSAKTAECARLLQRFSLGENNPELLERVRVLKCQ